MYRVEDVANFFLSKSSMTPKKLLKLVYYAYAWSLALMNEDENDLKYKLFNNRLEAWIHGPVVPVLYRKYKCFSGQTIPSVPEFDATMFDSDTRDILEQVWDVYGKYTGYDLESISHREEPWIIARGDAAPWEVKKTRITDKNIFKYYNKRFG